MNAAEPVAAIGSGACDEVSGRSHTDHGEQPDPLERSEASSVGRRGSPEESGYLGAQAMVISFPLTRRGILTYRINLPFRSVIAMWSRWMPVNAN